jgi:hypothetical protein
MAQVPTGGYSWPTELDLMVGQAGLPLIPALRRLGSAAVHHGQRQPRSAYQ